MNNKPEASVIVGTFNGSHKISHLLNALLNQTFQNFELIIVVDGSTDNTIQTVEEYRSLFKCFKIVVQSNEGRSRVRNKGVMESVSDLLIFYDDDMVPFNDSIQRHIMFHKKNNGILGGNQIELQSSDKTDIQNYKAFLTEVWTRKYSDEITKLDFTNVFFTAANCSIQKDIFKSMNGFDPSLTDAEDHDFAFRALCNGISVYFDKGNKAIHRDFITCITYIERLRLYAKAHGQLEVKYPDRYKNGKRKNHLIKRGIYRFFAKPYWPLQIEKKIITTLLPKRLRYKLYSLVIQALAIEYPEVKL